MNKEYTIKIILEPDFGCEGLPDGQVLTDTVILEDKNNKTKKVNFEDELLYKLNLNEGDKIVLDENDNIVK